MTHASRGRGFQQETGLSLVNKLQPGYKLGLTFSWFKLKTIFKRKHFIYLKVSKFFSYIERDNVKKKTAFNSTSLFLLFIKNSTSMGDLSKSRLDGSLPFTRNPH